MADSSVLERAIRISEIFGPTIQGEGALVGKPTVFVRTGGCDYRCSWCDTLHAVDTEYRHDWKPMTAAEIFAQVEELSRGVPLTISLSGGNPAIQPLGGLIALGKAKGYEFALETQGSVVKDWFAELDVLTLSPKPPSSAMETDLALLDACVAAAGPSTRTALKFPVMDEADYAFAREISARYPQLPVYLQPVNHTPPPPDAEDAAIDLSGIMDRMRWLIDRAMSDRWYSATILPQLHVLIWGNLRGV
ncbi:7-carboxy-7-deazaguanine synthase QueE [Roseibium sediminis]|uniref:7-carboxy-7-deazaguanine synthase QueE n=1 Tax=Roseibium sediminis TaxID=1775174 RepID=UPI00123DEA94|nr:7-carboxy-7-deazaguanine synthase QueE [Roseibium sediminis]